MTSLYDKHCRREKYITANLLPKTRHKRIRNMLLKLFYMCIKKSLQNLIYNNEKLIHEKKFHAHRVLHSNNRNSSVRLKYGSSQQCRGKQHWEQNCTQNLLERSTRSGTLPALFEVKMPPPLQCQVLSELGK